MASWREKLLTEGYFIRLRKEDYEAHIARPAPPVYRPKRFVFIYLEREERMPNFIHTFDPLTPGADSGLVEIDEIYTVQRDVLHQLFFGCNTQCRFYLDYPLGKKAAILEKRPWDVKTAPEVSYWDESKSPFHEPSPDAELFFLSGSTAAWTALNVTDIGLTPRLNFMGKRFIHSTVTEPGMIDRLERRIIPFRPVTIEAVK